MVYFLFFIFKWSYYLQIHREDMSQRWCRWSVQCCAGMRQSCDAGMQQTHHCEPITKVETWPSWYLSRKLTKTKFRFLIFKWTSRNGKEGHVCLDSGRDDRCPQLPQNCLVLGGGAWVGLRVLHLALLNGRERPRCSGGAGYVSRGLLFPACLAGGRPLCLLRFREIPDIKPFLGPVWVGFLPSKDQSALRHSLFLPR